MCVRRRARAPAATSHLPGLAVANTSAPSAGPAAPPPCRPRRPPRAPAPTRPARSPARSTSAVVRGQEHHRHRRRLRERPARRDRHQQPASVTATGPNAPAEQAHHPVARREIGHLGADLQHHAGALAARAAVLPGYMPSAISTSRKFSPAARTATRTWPGRAAPGRPGRARAPRPSSVLPAPPAARRRSAGDHVGTGRAPAPAAAPSTTPAAHRQLRLAQGQRRGQQRDRDCSLPSSRPARTGPGAPTARSAPGPTAAAGAHRTTAPSTATAPRDHDQRRRRQRLLRQPCRSTRAPVIVCGRSAPARVGRRRRRTNTQTYGRHGVRDDRRRPAAPTASSGSATDSSSAPTTAHRAPRHRRASLAPARPRRPGHREQRVRAAGPGQPARSSGRARNRAPPTTTGRAGSVDRHQLRPGPPAPGAAAPAAAVAPARADTTPRQANGEPAPRRRPSSAQDSSQWRAAPRRAAPGAARTGRVPSRPSGSATSAKTSSPRRQAARSPWNAGP